MHTHTIRLAAALATALLAAGCAAPGVQGQWADPQYTSRTLRDARVLVTCRGPDTTLARLCEERMVEALREAGALALRAPSPVDPAGGPEAVASAARAAGADAAVSTSVTVAGVTQVGVGPTVGIGFGGGGGRVGIGGGLSFPLGGMRPVTSYASSSVVLDPASGREIWSVRNASPARDDASVQVAALARGTVDAMARSGMFEKR
jgi:hypothetical protein